MIVDESQQASEFLRRCVSDHWKTWLSFRQWGTPNLTWTIARSITPSTALKCLIELSLNGNTLATHTVCVPTHRHGNPADTAFLYSVEQAEAHKTPWVAVPPSTCKQVNESPLQREAPFSYISSAVAQIRREHCNTGYNIPRDKCRGSWWCFQSHEAPSGHPEPLPSLFRDRFLPFGPCHGDSHNKGSLQFTGEVDPLIAQTEVRALRKWEEDGKNPRERLAIDPKMRASKALESEQSNGIL